DLQRGMPASIAPQCALDVFVVELSEGVTDSATTDNAEVRLAFPLDIITASFAVKAMEDHMIPLTLVHQQVKPLQQYIVVRGESDLLAVAGQLQQRQHQIFHQFGVEIGFGLVPQQWAGGAGAEA